MIIFPVIDIKDGVRVRLRQNDYDIAHRVMEDLQQTAGSFAESDTQWIHMVDLDRAKVKHPVNSEVSLWTVEAGLRVEVGGGTRALTDMEFYLSRGISRVILGSVALYGPQFVRDRVQRWDEQIAVGTDARDDKVAAEGWTQTSQVDYIELVEQMEEAGVGYIAFTDISKDGILIGPDLEQLDALNRVASCDIVASGGITNPQNIKDLCGSGLYGTICGKLLHSDSLDLKEVIAAAQGEK